MPYHVPKGSAATSPTPGYSLSNSPGFPLSNSLSFLCSFQGPSTRKTSRIGETMVLASHQSKGPASCNSPYSSNYPKLS